jgi:hypothetical protein
MLQMVTQQILADAAQGLLNRGNLHQNIGAVAVFFHHFVEAADLPFNSPQAFQVRCFDVGLNSSRFTGHYSVGIQYPIPLCQADNC